MLLRSKLSTTECINRLTQPYLSDPNIPDTSTTIKPKNKHTGTLGQMKWAILIKADAEGFEVQERTWLDKEYPQFHMEKSDVRASFNLLLRDNPSGGTDIEYKKIRSMKKILMMLPFPIIFGFLCIAVNNNPQYKHLMDLPGSTTFAGLMLFVPMIVIQWLSNSVIRLQKILDFTSKLLEAKEIMF